MSSSLANFLIANGLILRDEESLAVLNKNKLLQNVFVQPATNVSFTLGGETINLV